MNHFLLHFQEREGAPSPPLLKRKVEESSPGGLHLQPLMFFLFHGFRRLTRIFPLIRKAGNILAESESSSKILFRLSL